ncbi:MAG TPA: transglutaminase-like domain-containing protein [Polyangia bacterium]|nr:transglutaminase-like domain-containing protein [Polyangia bacterium]
MADRADLAMFAHFARRPEAELDLARAALLIAEPEYPGLDLEQYLSALDRLGADARSRLERPRAAGELPLRSVTRLLHDELGFRGNADDYYDPRNSFLNEVLDRRVGIPITLGIVMLEVAARAGVQAHGVSFPGHFLVRTPGAEETSAPRFIDPFDGALLDAAGLRRLMARATGEERDPDPRLLEPASKEQILVRMLNNLRGIYSARGDEERLRGVLERMQILQPTDELGRQIARLSPPPPSGRTFN